MARAHAPYPLERPNVKPPRKNRKPARFKAKSSFGRYLYYPDCEKARTLTRDLFSAKTLTQTQVRALLELGVTLKVSADNGL